LGYATLRMPQGVGENVRELYCICHFVIYWCYCTGWVVGAVGWGWLQVSRLSRICWTEFCIHNESPLSRRKLIWLTHAIVEAKTLDNCLFMSTLINICTKLYSTWHGHLDESVINLYQHVFWLLDVFYFPVLCIHFQHWRIKVPWSSGLQFGNSHNCIPLIQKRCILMCLFSHCLLFIIKWNLKIVNSHLITVIYLITGGSGVHCFCWEWNIYKWQMHVQGPTIM